MTVRKLKNRFYRRYWFKNQAYVKATNPAQNMLGVPLRVNGVVGMIAEVTLTSGSEATYKIVF